MIKGTLKSGFEFEIEESALDNMELLDAIAETEENTFAIGKVATLLLGEKQKKALYDHLRTDAGNIPTEVFANALVEIMNSSKTGKN